MSWELVQKVAAFAGLAGIAGLVAGGILYWGLKQHFGSYLTEKGRNLATKQDVAEITRKVEQVKVEYAMLVEHFKADHQLRLAAMDRRLQAHQDAFTLWHRLMATIFTDELHAVVRECEACWRDNAIYLDGEARRAFGEAAGQAPHHRVLILDNTPAGSIRLQESWHVIFKAGDILLKAVQLPPISGAERASLERQAPQ